jgi:cytochrome c peroxidase
MSSRFLIEPESVVKNINERKWSACSVLALSAMLVACSDSKTDTKQVGFDSKAALGEALFSDENLSRDRTQSCATCHNPEHGFIDNRLGDDDRVRAVSLGDDGVSFGSRNSPTASYAALIPPFRNGTRVRINSNQDDYQGFVGGQFHDGREDNLAGQAGGPPLNPLEMNMADRASVIERVRENAAYEKAFKALYGDTVFEDTNIAYRAMAQSIAEFEKTERFAPFDSAYDRYLAGDNPEYRFSKAGDGMSLFFSQQFTNCASCHQLRVQGHTRETFSSYEYHNIGVPVNTASLGLNGQPVGINDKGLFENPEVDDVDEIGKFKVPTLRNVAVTAPYMHNGVFNELNTVIAFYDHFLSGSTRSINPETGEAWVEPQEPDTLSENELREGRKFSDVEIEQMVCFLRSLTDARYEHLIEENGIVCD